ncbi:type II toxin-antitoxin system VapC family toxin (plasmid) [Haloarcula sp. NS06]|uniref:type II toxin-antitoxin system VapC family toxin n=1 Tax=unclassified Haloarcula TaxID=2624677 RepID=UPI0006790961|nr:type II toxin-antitoxin system VapC family toxin [Haloarcula sp. CBA1127]
MIAFDTSFLLDYLDGVEATAEYLADHEEKPFFAPSLALFEAYRGAARTGGREQIERVVSALDWAEPLPLEDAAAQEAALIEAELLDAGERVNLGDTLIAGVCRHNGARIVTRDKHFDRVQGLEVQQY